MEISLKYKDKLIKLFCNYDKNDDLTLDLYEFKLILLKFYFLYINDIDNIFYKVDLDNNSNIDIEEFLLFISKNNILLEKNR